MSLAIHVTFKEGGDWEILHVSGTVLAEIKSRGHFGDRQVFAIKYPDGKVWDCVLGKWR